MRKLLLVTLILSLASTARAVPSLQLYIDGASYEESSGTWVTDAKTFDLYVVGSGNITDVRISMAFMGLNKLDDPTASSLTVNGSSSLADKWTYGFVPVPYSQSAWNESNYPFYRHEIFPAWFNEMSVGDFGEIGGVEDISGPIPGWDPTMGYSSGSQILGEYKKLTISTDSYFGIHFDAYTYNQDGTITTFAPFTRDAAYVVPEPTTALLLGLGMAGAGIVRLRRKNKASN